MRVVFCNPLNFGNKTEKWKKQTFLFAFTLRLHPFDSSWWQTQRKFWINKLESGMRGGSRTKTEIFKNKFAFAFVLSFFYGKCRSIFSWYFFGFLYRFHSFESTIMSFIYNLWFTVQTGFWRDFCSCGVEGFPFLESSTVKSNRDLSLFLNLETLNFSSFQLILGEVTDVDNHEFKVRKNPALRP
jgi:hypothetical protein